MPPLDSPRPGATAGLSRPARPVGGGTGLVLALLCSALAACGREASTAGRRAPSDPVAPPAASSLAIDPARLAGASPDLLARLDGDAFNYFRFVGGAWARRVCEAFADEMSGLPATRLHGDAHIEQYALTAAARGLDDFDDSAVGPAVIDLVRFLGSIDLALRNRRWQDSGPLLYDRFLDGYRRGLADPAYLPPEPAIVRRLRSGTPRTAAAFLTSAESLMEPASAGEMPLLGASLGRVEELMRTVRPELPRGYLHAKRFGWLRTGIGSALTQKALARVEGPGPGDDDDLILEVKQLSDLAGVPCLTVTEAGAARVVTGSEQLSRLDHDILAVFPRPSSASGDAVEWWVRNWDPSYLEVTLADYASVAELAEVVHDAGAQLGAAGIREAEGAAQHQKREAERTVLARLEPRIRLVAGQLAEELVGEWTAFKNTRTAAPPTRP